MKKIIIIAVLTVITISTLNAQIKVANGGKVGIGTNNPQEKLHVYGSQFIDSWTPNYGSAIYAKVHYPLACSYHLNYGGRDVFYVCADGWLWTLKGGYFGSDIKLKKDITTINSPLATIKQLRGVKYKYKDNGSYNDKDSMYTDSTLNSLSGMNELKVLEQQRIGLIAQEVEQIVPEVVKTMPDSTKAIAYTDLIALLIEAMKEQQTQIETLQAIVYSQEQEIVSVKKVIDNCCSNEDNKSKLKSSSIFDETVTTDKTLSEGAKLFENVPNPFSINTEIKFEIPENSNSAKLIIHDMQGIELKSFNISQKGTGSITINGSELKAGMYLYTLLIDNRIIDTKRMLLTKE